MLEPEAPPARNSPNTGSLAPGVRKRVNKKKKKKKDNNSNINMNVYFDKSIHNNQFCLNVSNLFAASHITKCQALNIYGKRQREKI